MKLDLTQTDGRAALVTALDWTSPSELICCTVDHSIQRWTREGQHVGKVCSADCLYTDLHKSPAFTQTQGAGSEFLAVACSDGSFQLLTKSGKVTRSVQAHESNALCIRWNPEGTALATGGEDGVVKLWTRQGQLQHTMEQQECPVISLAWSPSSERLLFCHGGQLSIEQHTPSAEAVTWAAHRGSVLAVSWHPSLMLVLSAGEDCRYKVWSDHGQLLYKSTTQEHPVTSISWSPDGEVFAAGSFGSLLLCHASGCLLSKERMGPGSVQSLTWSSDGTCLAAAGGNGGVILAEVLGQKAVGACCHAAVVSPSSVRLQIRGGADHMDLQFRERVVRLSLGYGRLVVATSGTCSIHDSSSWSTSATFPLAVAPQLLLQSNSYCLLASSSNGVHVYSYFGQKQCSLPLPGWQKHSLASSTISMSDAAVAVIDPSNAQRVQLFKLPGGELMNNTVHHIMGISCVALSQAASQSIQLVAIVDQFKDLHVAPCVSSRAGVMKLESGVDCMRWHDSMNVLAAITKHQLVMWCYPAVVCHMTTNENLLPSTRSVANARLDAVPMLQSFGAHGALLVHADGSQVTVAMPPYWTLLHQYHDDSDWKSALCLCHRAKDAVLWTCLAAMALAGANLDTAEAALGACKDLARMQCAGRVKALPLTELRKAKLAVLRQQFDEAEAILLQAGLVYKAVRLNVKLHRWERALQLCQLHKAHTEAVLWHRSRYLAAARLPEQLPAFVKAGQGVQAQEEAVSTSKIQGVQEVQRAKQRGAAG